MQTMDKVRVFVKIVQYTYLAAILDLDKYTFNRIISAFLTFGGEELMVNPKFTYYVNQ